jgi:hypothetical protein
MLRTKEPVLFDALNVLVDVVYLRACRKVDVEGPVNRVTFDVEFMVLRNNVKTEKVNVKTGAKKEAVMDDSSGAPVPTGETIDVDQFEVQERKVCRPYLALYHTRKANYKADKFYTEIGNPTPAEFDGYHLSEIDRLNEMDWTGRELDRVSHFGLSANDFEVVSEEELRTLLTPYLLD